MVRQEVFVPYHAKEESCFLEIGQAQNGKPKIIESRSGEGWLAVVDCQGCYTRHTVGTAYILPGTENRVQKIAHGWGAYEVYIT